MGADCGWGLDVGRPYSGCRDSVEKGAAVGIVGEGERMEEGGVSRGICVVIGSCKVDGEFASRLDEGAFDKVEREAEEV